MYAAGLPTFKPSERWVAVVNDATDFGVGIYSPASSNILCNPLMGALGGTWATYATPIIGKSIHPQSTFEFDVYFAVGTPANIRSVFAGVRSGLVPTELQLIIPPTGGNPNLYFQGVAGATTYRLYLDDVRWPDTSFEIVNPFLRFSESVAGDLTVTAVVDSVEGVQSSPIPVDIEVIQNVIKKLDGSTIGTLKKIDGSLAGIIKHSVSGTWQ